MDAIADLTKVVMDLRRDLEEDMENLAFHSAVAKIENGSKLLEADGERAQALRPSTHCPHARPSLPTTPLAMRLPTHTSLLPRPRQARSVIL